MYLTFLSPSNFFIKRLVKNLLANVNVYHSEIEVL